MQQLCNLGYQQKISTHAPRTGGDYRAIKFYVMFLISTHAPRTGGDPCAGVSEVRPG